MTADDVDNVERRTLNALPLFEAEFARTDEEENDHDAEHFDRARILLEIMWVPSEGRDEGDEHSQCDQGGGRPEKEADHNQDSTGKLGQGSDQPPDIRHEIDAQASHRMSVVCPGCLTAGEFMPAENDENRTHTEATDQKSEIGVFGQRLEHATRFTQRAVGRQREDRRSAAWDGETPVARRSGQTSSIGKPMTLEKEPFIRSIMTFPESWAAYAPALSSGSTIFK
jgi:hypothetical protein